jgi:hypothetical protein
MQALCGEQSVGQLSLASQPHGGRGTVFDPLYDFYITPFDARSRIYIRIRRILGPCLIYGCAMADVIFLVLGVGFFAGAILYAYACDRL